MLKSDSGGGVFPLSPPLKAVFSQYQGEGWERGSGGVAVNLGRGGRRGTQEAFPHPSWDGSEGGGEAVHMPAGVVCHRGAFFLL